MKWLMLAAPGAACLAVAPLAAEAAVIFDHSYFQGASISAIEEGGEPSRQNGPGSLEDMPVFIAALDQAEAALVSGGADLLASDDGSVEIGQRPGATQESSDGGFMGRFSTVPEPSTWAMMLIGFGAVGYAFRRRPRYRLTQAV